MNSTYTAKNRRYVFPPVLSVFTIRSRFHPAKLIAGCNIFADQTDGSTDGSGSFTPSRVQTI